MADAFRVGQLPRDVQDRIFAFADNCLSQQYVGVPTVQTFLLLRPDFSALFIAVAEDEWRACAAEFYHNVPGGPQRGGGPPCGTCGVVNYGLMWCDVGLVQSIVHRPITFVPRDLRLPFWTLVEFDNRLICRRCTTFLLCR